MIIQVGQKQLDYYKGLLIKADWRVHHQVAERLAQIQPVPAHVLDFGAGEGALSLRLVDAGYRVTAVDIDAASFKCQEAEFVPLDFNRKPAIDAFVIANQGKYDVVLGIEVIEHIENPWDYVRSLVSMLRPGGVVLITTPNVTSWLSRFYFLFTGRYHQFADVDLSYGHISPISPWELQLILERCGLLDVAVKSAGTLPPIFITGLNRLLSANLFMLLLRPFMTGRVDGWCVMATGRKS